MGILKYNQYSSLEYVVSLFNTFCHTNIIKQKIRNCIQYLQKHLKNNINILINEIYSFQFSLPKFLKSQNSNGTFPTDF
jgi:hypothetical protein